MNNFGILIIDIQRGFVNVATEHIPRRVSILQNRYGHVFYTRFVNTEFSPYRRLVGWSEFGEGSEEAQLAFTPREGAVLLEKNVYSCVDRRFIGEIINRKIDSIHVCGLDSDVCVTKCAVDLFEHGIDVKVISNACASHLGEDFHHAAMKSIGRFIGHHNIIEVDA